MVTEVYDSIAPIYDSRYSTEDCWRENEVIKAMLAYEGGKVLDVGCGTGLLLEMFNIGEEDYVGIDPSGKMLEMAHSKFPGHIFMVSELETLPKRGEFDYVICLYGVASYIKPERLRRVLDHLRPGGQYFLMFYKPGYTPDYYNGTEDAIFRGNEGLIGGEAIEYNNFIIKTGRAGEEHD